MLGICAAAVVRGAGADPLPRDPAAARRADQISTLEATVQALAMLEGPSFDSAPLLEAFGRFVADVAARQQPQAYRRLA